MNKKIAIYSGVIPSTTFIENLVETLASENNTILLFGDVRKKVAYQNNNNIRVFPYPQSQVELLLFVCINYTKLYFQSKNKFNSLKKHIQSTGQSLKQRIRLWAKYLPVVMNLPDIFHVQWTSSANEWMFLKKVFKIKIVVSLRGVQVNINPVADSNIASQYRSFFADIDGFHAVSKAIANEALKYCAEQNKIKVIYSGIDFKKIVPFEKTVYNNSKHLRIISIGRFHWTKGFNYALDALHNLTESGIDYQYTILSNKIHEEILYQIEDLKLTERVKILNYLPQNNVFEMMQNSDVLLLPSVEEGIANVVLEAMAIGLPVISSDCGGMNEVIEDGNNGLLFQSRNSTHLADKIKSYILISPEKKESMIVAAKQKVAAQHGLKQLKIEMETFYDSILCE